LILFYWVRVTGDFYRGKGVWGGGTKTRKRACRLPREKKRFKKDRKGVYIKKGGGNEI